MSWQIRQGDWIEVLRTMPDESVHCVVTSPPYWGLRDYGVSGQLGLERTPDEYVAKMVEGFREVRRVLRKDGTLWLNLGDSYAGSGCGPTTESCGLEGGVRTQTNASPGVNWKNRSKSIKRRDVIPLLESVADAFLCKDGSVNLRFADAHDLLYTAITELSVQDQHYNPKSLTPKNLCGIPWRVALALQSDGWCLRSEIIWHKRNPMPESVSDRPTKSHEQIFLLTRSPRYFYDADAIREPHAWGDGSTGIYRGDKVAGRVSTQPGNTYQLRPGRDQIFGHANGRNRRSVWTITTSPFPEAHFATFPPEIPETCIKAGCPENGTVLDPFNGAGTTGLVATRLGRNYIGIELNMDYIAMATKRIENDAPLFNMGQAEAIEGRDPQQASPEVTGA
jgi:DNA modification methylase